MPPEKANLNVVFAQIKSKQRDKALVYISKAAFQITSVLSEDRMRGK